jgi:hypothetical protein
MTKILGLKMMALIHLDRVGILSQKFSHCNIGDILNTDTFSCKLCNSAALCNFSIPSGYESLDINNTEDGE